MFIADLHIHSKYSRATSKECVPEFLDKWARRKGIDLIGTGDFTHPAWRAELAEKLDLAASRIADLRAAVNFLSPVVEGEAEAGETSDSEKE